MEKLKLLLKIDELIFDLRGLKIEIDKRNDYVEKKIIRTSIEYLIKLRKKLRDG